LHLCTSIWWRRWVKNGHRRGRCGRDWTNCLPLHYIFMSCSRGRLSQGIIIWNINRSFDYHRNNGILCNGSTTTILRLSVRVIVFNTIFNNISITSLWSDLLVEVIRESHWDNWFSPSLQPLTTGSALKSLFLSPVP
jgi:hypothetical protein